MRYLASTLGPGSPACPPWQDRQPRSDPDIINIVKAGGRVGTKTSQKNIAVTTPSSTVTRHQVDGRSLTGRLAEAGTKDPGTRIADEMLNPKVQVYGDTAILSYNFFGLEQDKDGKVKPTRAKTSRVYVKQGGQWMLVHANFGADPLPSQ